MSAHTDIQNGDLAHEFYRQVVRNDKVTMERCLDNLIPQGDVDLVIPRLHVDLPVFLYEMPNCVHDSASRR
ncbi:hypothetical protein C0Q70_15392 [Pomacea canaliculata]|uniref:Uncharacterized protein n=1 Tax=Pomacea canaliculata TaxID=400727 RepID=A0A2T7NUP4_POMCA|nr:hypothetical protein C0Q70_15392 [Pomacea canaliculata]